MYSFGPYSGSPDTPPFILSDMIGSESFVVLTEAAATKIRAATFPFITRYYDSPANQPFNGTLEATLRIDRSIASSDGYSGFSENISELSLINAEGDYDDLVDQFSVNGQEINLSIGTMSGRFVVDSYDSFVPFAKLIGERFVVNRTRLTIEMRDPAAALINTTVQQNVYGGSGGLDGGEDITGLRRPRGFGIVFNATPTLVIGNELVWQFNDGPVASIEAVKDGGVELDFFADYPTTAAMRADAGFIDPGFYASCIAEGYFQTGGINFKQVTVDFTALQLTTADVIKTVAVEAAGLTTSAFDPEFVDVSGGGSLAGLDRTFSVTSGGLTYSNASVRESHSNGKWVFSIVLGNDMSVSDIGVGFSLDRSIAHNQWLGSTLQSVAFYGSDGQMYYNGVGLGYFMDDWSTAPAGTIITIAVDLDTSIMWIKLNQNDWSGGGDPAAGTGGFSIGAFAGLELFPGVSVKTTGTQSTTINLDINDLPEGFNNWSTTTVNVGTFVQLNTDQPATISYFLDDGSSETCAEMFTKLMRGIGGWWGMSPLGQLQVRLMVAPGETASAYYSDSDQIVSIDRVDLPEGVDPPPHRRRAVYARNWTVMTDLFGAVSEFDPDMAEYLKMPYKLVSTPEEDGELVLANYPDAPDPEPIESFFAFLEDAQAEVDRIFELYTTGLHAYRFTLKQAMFMHDIGDVINVTADRLGLENGRYLVAVEVSDSMDTMVTDITGFG